MVTDFDCWHPDHDAVTVQDIITVLTANAEKAKALVARLARDFPREHEPCPVGSDRALDAALITAPNQISHMMIAKIMAAGIAANIHLIMITTTRQNGISISAIATRCGAAG